MMYKLFIALCVLTTCSARQHSNTSASQYSLYEVRLGASQLPTNPFALWCHVLVSGPSTSRYPNMNITMFYDGGTEWAWRFTPDVVGEWQWSTRCEKGYGLDGIQGSVSIVAAQDGRLGAVLVDPHAPLQMIYEAGKQYTLVGIEADWLWAMGLLHGKAAMQSVVDGLDALGINHVLVQIYAHSTSGQKLPPLQPPRVSPTPTTPWASFDQQTLDLSFWRNYDDMLGMFAARNMIAHVMFFVGNKNVEWPAENSTADDIYWRYAMARLGAHPSVVLDVSKEAGSANAKRSVGYFIDRLRLMRSMNAHGRLLTAHSGFDWTNQCKQAPELCQVTSAQVHFPYSGDDASALGCSNSFPPLPCPLAMLTYYHSVFILRLNVSLCAVPHIYKEYYPALFQAAADATAPYINVEFFYQWGPSDGCHFSCCGSCTNSSGAQNPSGNLNFMRKVMWENYMAGITGACWYHDDLGWDVLDPRALTTTAGEMRALRTLRDFWESVPRREFVALPTDLCVASLQPSASAVHCLVRKNGSQPAEMILHVRREESARRVSQTRTAPPPPWANHCHAPSLG